MYRLRDYDTYKAPGHLEDHWREAERAKPSLRAEARLVAVLFAVVLCGCGAAMALAPVPISQTTSGACDPELSSIRLAEGYGSRPAQPPQGALQRFATSMAHPCAS